MNEHEILTLEHELYDIENDVLDSMISDVKDEREQLEAELRRKVAIETVLRTSRGYRWRQAAQDQETP